MEANLGTLEIHAAGKVAAGAGAALSDAVNVVGVVRNGAGDYTVTLSTEIDATQRIIMLTGAETDAILEHVVGNDTDSTFDVGADVNGTPTTPADRAFNFLVLRTVKLS